MKALTDVTQVFRSENDESNTAMQDALEELDKNHWTENDEFDAAVQDALDKTDINEFELDQKEWHGVINSMMMMNVYRAAGSGDNVPGNQPTFQRVKHTNIDHITQKLSTHSEHPHRSNQHDKTLMMQRPDVDETG